MSIQSVFDKLKQLDGQARDVRFSTRTQFEQEQALARINAERKSLKHEAAAELNSAKSQLRKAYKSAVETVRITTEASKRRWDYSRLDQETRRAQDAIDAALSNVGAFGKYGSPQEALFSLVADAKLSGDRHAMKALAEAGIKRLDGQVGAQDVKQHLERELTKLDTTPEQVKAGELLTNVKRLIAENAMAADKARQTWPDDRTLDDLAEGKQRDTSLDNLFDDVQVTYSALGSDPQGEPPEEWAE